ncbi:MAG: hypothetical protein LBQ37_01775 [Elusimicrobiota bacterium]|jgi:ADP-heptose:LPS heptosyltransferase|nr:hypothetical protein [Elusimicrobiota bacterium]
MGQLNIISRNIRTAFAKFLFDKKERKLADGNYYKSEGILDVLKFRSVLFVIHDDRIGDMIISTIEFREIKKKYPNIKVFVLCGKNGKETLKYNPNVDEIFEVCGKFCKDLKIYKRLREKHIGILIDFFEFNPRPSHLLFLRIINPFFLIGFSKKNYNTYDLSIDENFFDTHMVNRHKAVLKILGIDNPNLDYDIFFTQKEKNEAQKYLDKSGGKIKVVINPFASSKHRTFKYEKLRDLALRITRTQKCGVYILCPPYNYKSIKNIEKADNNIIAVRLNSILSVAAFIKECDIVISPDTSIIHIASAFNKKTIGLYLDFSFRQEKTDIIWGPNNSNAVIINADAQNGKIENDINNIDNNKIFNKFKEMI